MSDNEYGMKVTEVAPIKSKYLKELLFGKEKDAE